jgi:hypothetical protein
MKKLVSLGLALVMCLALMIPALASEQTFSTENSSLTPTIEVEMPSSAGVVLNPYGMTYTGDLLPKNATDAQKTAQIISNVFAITNKTQGAKLEVKATVSGVVGGNVQLVDAKDTNLTKSGNDVTGFKSTETGNKVYMLLTYNFTGADKTNKDAPTSLTGLTRETAFTNVITDAEQNMTTIVLPPSDGTKHSYVVYQFSGVAVSKPAEPWSENDTVGATFVYTFTATPDPVTTAS